MLKFGNRLTPGVASGKEFACQCRRQETRIPSLGRGRSPGGGHGDPLQYSCLENPMDRGAWQAIVYRVTESQKRLKCLSMHMHARFGKYLDAGVKGDGKERTG